MNKYNWRHKNGERQTLRVCAAPLGAHTMTCFDIASTLTTAESQIEKFAAMFKNLQPTEEFINFIQPNFDLLQEIKTQVSC